MLPIGTYFGTSWRRCCESIFIQNINIVTNCILQTASNDSSFPFTLLNISPPVFVQPLPKTPSAPPSQQMVIDLPPHILLSNFKIKEPTTHNTHTSGYTEEPSNLLDYPMTIHSPVAEKGFDYSPASPVSLPTLTSVTYWLTNLHHPSCHQKPALL